MSSTKLILKNMSALLLSRIVTMALGFLYTILVARYLGPSDFGVISFAIAITGIFSVLANFGIDTIVVRESSKAKELANKYLASGFLVKSILGTLAFILASFVLEILHYPELTKSITYIMMISVVINGISTLFSDVQQAFERMELIAFYSIFQSALSLVLAFIAVTISLEVYYFAVIYLVVAIISAGFNVIITSSKVLRPRFDKDIAFCISLTKQALPLAISAMMISIYYWMDSVMLSYMKGDLAVGFYSAAHKFVILPQFIPSVYFNSIFPLISRIANAHPEKFRFLINESWRYMCLSAFLTGFSVTVFSDYAIGIIYGPSYSPSIGVLQVLIWSPVFIFMNQVYWYIFNATGKQIIGTKMTVLGAFTNLLLNFALIPPLSYLGAAIATVITECVVLVAEIFVGRKAYGYLPSIVITAKAAVVGLTSATFSLLLKNFDPILAGIVFLAVYATLSYCTGLIKKEDIEKIIPSRFQKGN